MHRASSRQNFGHCPLKGSAHHVVVHVVALALNDENALVIAHKDVRVEGAIAHVIDDEDDVVGAVDVVVVDDENGDMAADMNHNFASLDVAVVAGME